jgi:hypothetical protein
MNKIKARQYPYYAWVLQPSFKPKQILIVGRVFLYSYPEYDKTKSGTSYHIDKLFLTKDAAVAHGWERIREIEADLAKRTERLAQKRQELEKASV